MPTGDFKVNIYNRRLMAKSAMKDNFLDFLVDEIDEKVGAFLNGSIGTLDDQKVGLNNGSGGSTFDIDASNATKVLTGQGKVVDLTVITGTGITTAIPFENTAATLYYIGVRFQEVPDDIEDNPRTGDPEYPKLKQTFGELDNPNSVADNTTYIRLIINDITESNVDHSGRTVQVWLADPVSGVENVAYWSGTSVYSSPDNYVDIPYSGSSGPLGQDTGVNPPSTAAADYFVFIEGVTWKKNTDLSADGNYAFLGTGSGGSPPTFSIANQNNVFFITLDRAYDGGVGGTGGGRIINVDQGAVELRTPSSTGDEQMAQLRLETLGRNEYLALMYEAMSTHEGAIPYAALNPVDNGSELIGLEPVSLTGTNTLNFTRGGPLDLTFSGLRLNKNLHLVLVLNAPNPASNGFWLIDTIAATALTVKDPQNSASDPGTWTNGAASAMVIVPRFLIGGDEGAQGSKLLDWIGSVMVLRTGTQQDVPLRVLPDGCSGDAIDIKDNDDPPASAFRFRPQDKDTTNPPFNFDLPVRIEDTGDTTARPLLQLESTSASMDLGTLTPQLPFDFRNNAGNLIGGMYPFGTNVHGHHFRDDMGYYPTQVPDKNNLPKYYTFNLLSNGDIFAVDYSVSNDIQETCGALILNTGAILPGMSTLVAPAGLVVNSTKGFQWMFNGMIRVRDTNNMKVQFGFNSLGPNPLNCFFEYDASLLATWEIKYVDAAGVLQQQTTGVAVNQLPVWFYLKQLGSRTWQWAILSETGAAQNVANGLIDIGPPGVNFAGNNSVFRPELYVETLDAVEKEVLIHMWEWLDTGSPVWSTPLDYG